MKFFNLIILILFISSSVFAQDLSHISKQKPLQFSGGLQTTVNYQTSSLQMDSYQPFSYLISLNLNPQIYGISLPFSLAYSRGSRQFSQPFYRFGISPTYKWIKLNLGHRSTQFSKYTVAGLKSLGAGIELTPKKFRFAFMYGSFVRQRNFRTVYPMDNLNMDDYSRKGYALKIGLGSKRNFVDIIMMKINDDVSNFTNDTLPITPESNLALALNTKFTIAKKLFFRTEVAGSVLTRDMKGKSIDASGVNKTLQSIANFANVNSSTILAFAGDASLDYKLKTFNIGLQFKHVDPGYRTLGTYMIRNDFESYMLNLGFHKKSFSINGGIGKARDNLKKQKMAQTNRIITRLNISYQSAKIFSITANYNNFSTQQTEGRIPLNDTIRIYQANKTIGIMPQFRFINKKRAHIIVLNYTYADMLDKNPYANVSVPALSNIAFAQYNFMNIPNAFGISLNMTYTKMKAATNNITTYGPNIGFQKRLLKNKMNLQIGGGYILTDTGISKGNVIQGLLRSSYKIGKSQYIRFSFMLNKSNTTGVNAFVRDYTRSMLTYGYKF